MNDIEKTYQHFDLPILASILTLHECRPIVYWTDAWFSFKRNFRGVDKMTNDAEVGE